MSQLRLTTKVARGFAGLNFSRKPVSKNLDKYDVLVVGANSGALFSRHFDQVSHGHYSMMVAFDKNVNQCAPMRNIYEQQRATKSEYFINAKLGLSMYSAHTDLVGIEKFIPDENAVVLKNGRRIEYNFMVNAMGLKENMDSIKGFYDAWLDTEHPVYTCTDHMSWRSAVNKHMRMHYSCNHGDALFVIPPYPFSGEVENYNMFLTKQIYNWHQSHGKMSPLSSFTVVNANDRFVQHLDSADNFIKEQLKKRDIPVEYGLQLKEIKKDSQEAVFWDPKTNSMVTKKYNALYSLMPTTYHQNLVDAGLATKESNFLLDVDHETLQHKKYKNIFGLGDVCNLPTSKTFWGSFHQVHVVRDNLMNFIQGKEMNALYNGYSKAALLMGQYQTTYVCHSYNQQEAWHNLLAGEGGIMGLISWLRYLYWAKRQKKIFLQYYLFKNWGPPFYKKMKTFGKLSQSQRDALQAREAEYDRLYPNRLTYKHVDPHTAH